MARSCPQRAERRAARVPISGTPVDFEHHIDILHIGDNAIIARGDQFSWRHCLIRLGGCFNDHNFAFNLGDVIGIDRSLQVNIGGDHHAQALHHLGRRDNIGAHLSGADQTDATGFPLASRSSSSVLSPIIGY